MSYKWFISVNKKWKGGCIVTTDEKQLKALFN